MTDHHLPTELNYRDLYAHLRRPNVPDNGVRHYDVDRHALTAGRLTRMSDERAREHPYPEHLWFVWLEEDSCVLRDTSLQALYYRTPEAALQGLYWALREGTD